MKGKPLVQFEFRLAVPSDANEIAKHMCYAGGGLMEFLLDGIVPDVSADQLLALSIAEENASVSYKNTLVVETNSGIRGVLLAYPFSEFCISAQMEMFVDREKLDHVRNLYKSRVENSYYVHALSVDEGLAGKGVGKSLLEFSYDIALEEGFDNVSLHVWRDNLRAINLYRSNGFVEVDNIEIDRTPLILHDNGMVLMRRDLK